MSEENVKPYISKCMLYAIFAGMLVCGTVNTLVLKIQDDTNSPGPGYPFTHPYLQTSFMFLGESFCFFFLWIKMVY